MSTLGWSRQRITFTCKDLREFAEINTVRFIVFVILFHTSVFVHYEFVLMLYKSSYFPCFDYHLPPLRMSFVFLHQNVWVLSSPSPPPSLDALPWRWKVLSLCWFNPAFNITDGPLTMSNIKKWELHSEDREQLQYLDSLSKATFPQDFSMNEIWRSEDTMSAFPRVYSKRLWANHVSPLRNKWQCPRRQRTLVYTTAAPEKEVTNWTKIKRSTCILIQTSDSTYQMCLDRIPVLPWGWVGERLIFCSSISSLVHGSSSRLGSFGVEVSLSWTQESGQLMLTGDLSDWRGDCGLCSMVIWSGLLVSWTTRFI